MVNHSLQAKQYKKMKTYLFKKVYSRVHRNLEHVNSGVTITTTALYNKVYRFTSIIIYRLTNNNNFTLTMATFFKGLGKRGHTHALFFIIFCPIWTFAVNRVNL